MEERKVATDHPPESKFWWLEETKRKQKKLINKKVEKLKKHEALPTSDVLFLQPQAPEQTWSQAKKSERVVPRCMYPLIGPVSVAIVRRGVPVRQRDTGPLTDKDKGKNAGGGAAGHGLSPPRRGVPHFGHFGGAPYVEDGSARGALGYPKEGRVARRCWRRFVGTCFKCYPDNRIAQSGEGTSSNIKEQKGQREIPDDYDDDDGVFDPRDVTENDLEGLDTNWAMFDALSAAKRKRERAKEQKKREEAKAEEQAKELAKRKDAKAKWLKKGDVNKKKQGKGKDEKQMEKDEESPFEDFFTTAYVSSTSEDEDGDGDGKRHGKTVEKDSEGSGKKEEGSEGEERREDGLQPCTKIPKCGTRKCMYDKTRKGVYGTLKMPQMSQGVPLSGESRQQKWSFANPPKVSEGQASQRAAQDQRTDHKGSLGGTKEERLGRTRQPKVVDRGSHASCMRVCKISPLQSSAKYRIKSTVKNRPAVPCSSQMVPQQRIRNARRAPGLPKSCGKPICLYSNRLTYPINELPYSASRRHVACYHHHPHEN